MKIKRRLTHSEEFEVLKLVFDKFLWLGTAFLFLGLYFMIEQGVEKGLWYLVGGALIMLVFAAIIVREFEMMR